MKILALDTATAACSAALWDQGVIRAARHVVLGRGHAEALLPMIDAVMAEAGLAYGALDLIATTVGPGAFTGLRIGLAAARGLALAGGLPMIGVTSLEALAHGVAAEARAGRSVAALLNARRGEVYGQAFDGVLMPLGPPLAGPPDGFPLPGGPLLLVGDGAPLVAEAVPGADIAVLADRFPDAAVVAALAAARYDPDAPPSPPPEPLYLRAAGASPQTPREAGR